METTIHKPLSFIQEALEIAHNDISKINTVQIVEPDIEQQHFEDIYQEDRLNRDVDINDIDTHRLMFLIEQQEHLMKPITTAIIRKMSTPYTNMRVQFDSGVNRSITPHLELLHDVQKITGTHNDEKKVFCIPPHPRKYRVCNSKFSALLQAMRISMVVMVGIEDT